MNPTVQRSGTGSSAIIIVIETLILIGAIIFAAWAFSTRQQYKNNDQQFINTAVAAAIQKQKTTDATTYAAQAQLPLVTYTGPQAYGSLVINYPKDWSAYVDDTGSGGALVDGYFNPGVVPSIQSQTSVFALRVEVVQETYDQEVQQFTSLASSGGTTVTAYALPKVPSAVGIEVNGTITGQQQGEMVVLPVRQNTIEIWTQGTSYTSDFNNIILPNFSFSP